MVRLRARGTSVHESGLKVRGLALVAVIVLPGCFTMQHTVGRGPQTTGPQTIEETRWFALYGLKPFFHYDTATMIGPDVHDYRVTTKFSYLDVFVSAFTSFATIYCQTVVVEK